MEKNTQRGGTHGAMIEVGAIRFEVRDLRGKAELAQHVVPNPDSIHTAHTVAVHLQSLARVDIGQGKTEMCQNKR